MRKKPVMIKQMLKLNQFVYIFLFLLLPAILFASSQKTKLIFLNWPGYIHPDVISSFEKQFDIDVHEVFYETDELKEEILLANDAKGFDVMVGSGITMVQYLKRRWIDPIKPQDIPNISKIKQKFQNFHPALKNYAVPYLWGTLGIGYRKDKIIHSVTSWGDLFKPRSYLRGKILMINDSKDTIGAALKLGGHSFNSKELTHYNEVFHILQYQKSYVKDYSYVDISEKSQLLTGEIWMAMMYNGDALALKQKNSNIAFCNPKEGTNLWVDYLAVMAASKHKKLARAFINHIQSPKNAALISMKLKYATPNDAAEVHMPKSHLENTIIFPSEEILEKSEVFCPLPPNIIKKRNNIFMSVIHGKH
ncbi:spermidine/putrescine ABC transporter substrate-binding protein [Candidatus Magnetomorum sp. HK-1]|nr:spermidine/putrescine ABC transporter substrate-binding protein [Candidatus Magnetomorum sp. HK-1]